MAGYAVTIQSNTFGPRGDQLEQGARDVVRKTGLAVIVLAAPFTPVDTGLLVSSPEVRPSEPEPAVDVVWSPEYAAIQEARKRYAEQGAELALPGFVEAMREVIDG